jgi:AcrR family transcriptional regulator
VTSLRARRREETRDLLLRAAVDLFVAQGYEETSMDEIASRAGASRATVFNYFAHKEDFLIEWADRRRLAISQLLADSAGAGESPLTTLRRAILAIADLYVADAKETRPMIRSWLRAGGPLLPRASATAELFRPHLVAGRQHGEVRKDIDTGAAARLALAVYLGTLYAWASNDEADDWLRSEFEANLPPLFDGLAPRSAAPRKPGTTRGRDD